MIYVHAKLYKVYFINSSFVAGLKRELGFQSPVLLKKSLKLSDHVFHLKNILKMWESKQIPYFHAVL